MRKALTEMKIWALQREFVFTQPKKQPIAMQHGSEDVPLIKEYQTVLSEVGDHQGLLSSLKQAVAYALFKVGGRD